MLSHFSTKHHLKNHHSCKNTSPNSPRQMKTHFRSKRKLKMSPEPLFVTPGIFFITLLNLCEFSFHQDKRYVRTKFI